MKSNTSIPKDLEAKLIGEVKDEHVPLFIEYFEKLNAISTHKLEGFGYNKYGYFFIKASTGITLIK